LNKESMPWPKPACRESNPYGLMQWLAPLRKLDRLDPGYRS
jgi:hypothetical protein